MSYTSLYPTLTINTTSVSYKYPAITAGNICSYSDYCNTGFCCAYLYN